MGKSSRVALVTGCSSGIGRALARELRIGRGRAALPFLTRLPRALRDGLLVRRFGPDPRRAASERADSGGPRSSR
jgi:NAD(P)-dependent dehydrogenase (short-subunit alcohol dehydrogenase family)